MAYSIVFDEMLKFRNHLSGTNSKFSKFCMINEKILNQRLDALQTEPLQRIARYTILLKGILKNFSASSDEGKSIQTAVDVVEKICTVINQKMTDRTSYRMVCVLQENLFRKKVFIVTQQRKCIRFGLLVKVNLSEVCFLLIVILFQKFNHRTKIFGAENGRQYLFILFSDFLCYSTLSNDGKSAIMKHVIPLGGVRIRPDDAASKDEPGFLILNSAKNLTVVANSMESRASWIADILAAVNAHESEYRAKNSILPFGDLSKIIMGTDERSDADRAIEAMFRVFPEETPWIQ